jgi:hypothetical protein
MRHLPPCRRTKFPSTSPLRLPRGIGSPRSSHPAGERNRWATSVSGGGKHGHTRPGRKRLYQHGTRGHFRPEGSTKGLHTCITFDSLQLNPKQKPIVRGSCRALSRTRTVDPSLPCDPCGNRSQPTATVFACSGASAPIPFATGCQRLQPRGSIKAPSHVVRYGYTVCLRVLWTLWRGQVPTLPSPSTPTRRRASSPAPLVTVCVDP